MLPSRFHSAACQLLKKKVLFRKSMVLSGHLQYGKLNGNLKIGGNSIESTTSWKHLGNPIFLGTTIHGSLCLSATDACSTHHQPDHFRTHYFECSLAANSAGSRMESELVYLNRNLEKHINDIAKHIIDRFNKLLT